MKLCKKTKINFKYTIKIQDPKILINIRIKILLKKLFFKYNALEDFINFKASFSK